MVQFRISIPNMQRVRERVQGIAQFNLSMLLGGIAEAVGIVAYAAVLAETPVRGGLLLASTRLHVASNRVLITADARQASFVLHGTAAHDIFPRSKQALYWPGAAHPVRRVHHPGTRPNPYGERAFNRVQPQMASEAARVAEGYLRQLMA